MTRRHQLVGALPLSITLTIGGCTADRPNFLFVIIDDLGWKDTGVYGSWFYETPNIDRLAAEGVRFSQFYTASPVCSPTRASIMTGKYPARVKITNWIGGEQDGRLRQAEYRRALPLEETTIGDVFKEAGYTTGYIGKWHLGGVAHLPQSQGFDYNVAVNHAGQPGSYFYPYRSERMPTTNVPDLADGTVGEYLTDRLTDEALRFVETHRRGPFLLVLSHYAVHTPLQSKEDLRDKYRGKAERLPPASGPPFQPEGDRAHTKQHQDHAVYAGMVESTDQSVGRLLDKLDELGLAERTVIVFVSDNGGLSTLINRNTGMPTANVPLRAGKGWLYEGGIRAPMIIKWPEVTLGSRLIDEPTISNDILPTLLEIAGIDDTLAPLDGTSLVPLLRGSGAIPPRSLFWHFPHYHGSGNTPTAAIRDGDYKLIEWLEDGRVELYDLVGDLSETRDLAAELPDLTATLRSKLRAWRDSLDAEMPTPNPNWPGSGGN
jgi:arylsulfatase A-like enzyme